MVCIVKRACGLGERPKACGALSILGETGHDFFQLAIEPHLRDGFECRSPEDTAAFYGERGVVDLMIDVTDSSGHDRHAVEELKKRRPDVLGYLRTAHH